MSSSDTRTLLLQAASRILEQQGSAHLTIDAVAKEAGVSKGGVLYHFPAKAALIRAMVEFHMAMIDAELDCALAAEPPGPGRFVRAWIGLHANRPPLTAERHLDMMTFITRNPELHALVSAHRRQHQERMLDDGLDPALAALLAFAAEGLGLAAALGADMITLEQRQQVLALARKLAMRPDHP